MSIPCVDTTLVTTRPQQEKVTIHTTLYDLIASINADIAPEDDHLVTAAILRLLDGGRVNFLRR